MHALHSFTVAEASTTTIARIVMREPVRWVFEGQEGSDAQELGAFKR